MKGRRYKVAQVVDNTREQVKILMQVNQDCTDGALIAGS